MIYLKSIAAGIAGAIGGMLLSAIGITIGTSAGLQFEMWRQRGRDGGIGAVSAGVAETIVFVGLILGVVGFVAGFWWEFRRASP
jgi:hypothetical protein